MATAGSSGVRAAVASRALPRAAPAEATQQRRAIRERASARQPSQSDERRRSVRQRRRRQQCLSCGCGSEPRGDGKSHSGSGSGVRLSAGDPAGGGCQCRNSGARRRVTKPRPARVLPSEGRRPPIAAAATMASIARCSRENKCAPTRATALRRVDCESGERTQLPSQRPSGAAHQRG